MNSVDRERNNDNFSFSEKDCFIIRKNGYQNIIFWFVSDKSDN